MTTEFKLPELGENVQSGAVVGVLVAVGDTVAVNQPVLELETDKATIEVPSSVSGTVTAIHVQEGDKVSVGQLVLTVGEANGQPAGIAPAAAPPVAAPEPPPQAPTAAPVVAPPVETEAAPQEFYIPDLGENVAAGNVVSVLVAVGDTVAIDQPVLELETDKAALEVPSTVSGVVTAVHIREGDKASVGQRVLTVLGITKADAPEAAPAPAQPAAPEPAPAAEPERQAETVPAAPSHTTVTGLGAVDVPRLLSSAGTLDMPIRHDRTLIPAAPNVRRIARELGVNIADVKGSGPGGHIYMDDVKRHAYRLLRALRAGLPLESGGGRPAPPLPDFAKWGQVEHHPMSNIRKATARQMETAWTHVPHVTQFDKADITDLEELRQRFGPKVVQAGGKLTVTAILLKVVAGALKEFPKFNASIDMAKEEVIFKSFYHIGVAVDTPRGLLVPVIRNVDQKNIIELSVELGEVAAKARDKKLGLDEMQGGTFTITNLGGIGGTNFTPIVNTPEVAILGVARGGIEPVFNKKSGQFEPRTMMPLALSYDHRLIDGADGARFLRWIVEYLEQPFLTALQGW